MINKKESDKKMFLRKMLMRILKKKRSKRTWMHQKLTQRNQSGKETRVNTKKEKKMKFQRKILM